MSILHPDEKVPAPYLMNGIQFVNPHRLCG